MRLFRLIFIVALAVGSTACRSGFQLKRFTNHEALYRAAVREYEREHWENAIAAFEKLTLELPARDTLLPGAHYFLGRSHTKRGEHLLAAQSFVRVTESFPDDTLADDALYAAGRSYERLWRKPDLDAQYGLAALNTFRTLLGMYPNSLLRPRSAERVTRLEEMFATKEYENGMHYLRRKAYDSAIIYFRGVIEKYPDAKKSRNAHLRLIQTYRAIKYREDAADVCLALQKRYPSDPEAREACGPSPVAGAKPDSAAVTP